ncbi:MAG: DUF3426 domain-containing protein [Thermodesulfobacteriota bacterium]
MRVACSRCQALYEVPDEKLARGAVKVRCSSCGHTFGVRARSAQPPSPPPAERDFESFGASPASPPPFPPEPGSPDAPSPPEAGRAPEARFEDFDFSARGGVDLAEALSSTALPSPSDLPEREEPEPQGLTDETLSALGELDLGDFDDLDKGLDLDLRGEPLPAAPPAREPLEQVRGEDLITPRGRESRGAATSDEVPRLDIQRGPRRPEPAARPSPILARDRRRSPLFWVVALVALVTLGYTGYNLAQHPEAFTFLSPAKVRSLWQSRQIEAVLGVEGLNGYYREVRAGRRVFVIRGEVVNRASGSQSLIRVEGSLYGKDGKTLATKQVYSGNVLSDAELQNLSDAQIEARLQNEVGDAMQNMEVGPGARVPFTVVFPAPPDGVDKFSARPVDARSGSGT